MRPFTLFLNTLDYSDLTLLLSFRYNNINAMQFILPSIATSALTPHWNRAPPWFQDP